MDVSGNLYYISMILIFLAVVLLIEGVFFLWRSYMAPETKRIQHRLRALSAASTSTEEISIVKNRLLSEVPIMQRLLLTVPRIQHLDKLLVQSGLSMNVATLVGLMLLAGLAAFIVVVFLLHAAALFGIVLGLVCASLPAIYLLRARHKRLNMVDQHLPDALDLISRAMRAGHAFSSALKMVGDEMPEPLAGEFRTTFEEINFGIKVPDALANLAARVPSMDIRYFVVSVLIQRETGGNLTEILDNISNLIRARLRLLGTIRVLSAEGRLSAWILTVLPFAVALMIHLINPTFMRLLWEDPAGLKVAITGMVMIVVGIFWMWRLIKIRI